MKRPHSVLTALFAAILAVISGLSLVSCGGNANAVKVNPDKETYVVGICQLVQHPALDAATHGFKDALTAELQKEGRKVEFREGNAQGDSNTCSTIVNSFVSADVDLIMANATAALQAAYNATQTIPILGTSVTEYGVALSIPDFNGTVGGNVSGTADLAPLEEQAQMMLDLLPGLTAESKIGILYCSAEPNSSYQADVVRTFLTGKGITCRIYTFSDSNDIAQVTERASAESDAIYVPTDNTIASNTAVIDNICRAKKVPVFAGEEGICSGCGFATLSISYYNIGKKTGEMAAKVLLGKESISSMPIAYDEAPVKKYNEEICRDLGLSVPEDYQKIGG